MSFAVVQLQNLNNSTNVTVYQPGIYTVTRFKARPSANGEMNKNAIIYVVTPSAMEIGNLETKLFSHHNTHAYAGSAFWKTLNKTSVPHNPQRTHTATESNESKLCRFCCQYTVENKVSQTKLRTK